MTFCSIFLPNRSFLKPFNFYHQFWQLAGFLYLCPFLIKTIFLNYSFRKVTVFLATLWKQQQKSHTARMWSLFASEMTTPFLQPHCAAAPILASGKVHALSLHLELLKLKSLHLSMPTIFYISSLSYVDFF